MNKSWLFPESVDPHLALANKALFWGENPFTCFLIIDGIPLFIEDHWERLQKMGEYFYAERFQKDEVLTFLQEKLNSIEKQEGIYYGRVTLMADFNDQVLVHFFVKDQAYYESEFLHLEVSDKNKEGEYPTFVKLGQYAAFLREVEERKCDDLIYCDSKGMVKESGRANLFWREENTVYTPELCPGILDGVTRKNLILCLKQNGIELKEGVFSLESLLSSDEVWLTNSLKGIHGVTRIKNKAYQQSDLFLTMRKSFDDYVEDYLVSRR